ncbi:FG-GAP-like repeat-containing protein [Streptomyces sp. DT190]|uniref:FG-GAP-like repeat-containing protein n=1 Tax=unclassified Streptomyces TaxID=2593676 RepID=UPI003CE6B9BE
MPVPMEELKLEIVNAATERSLAARAAPSTDGALVVRALPEDGPGQVRWHFVPGQEERTYLIRDAADGKVLDHAADRGVRRADAAAGRKSQLWCVVPVEGHADLYFIEAVADGTVLDLEEPGDGQEETRVVLRAHDENAGGQRWRLVPAEPERTSDAVLRWSGTSHWNGHRSWRLARSAALRPVPGAKPSFSDLLLVLERFGGDPRAGGWQDTGTGPAAGQPGPWAQAGARFLADTTGTGRHDVVALTPAKGAVTSRGRGDGTFEDEERVLCPPGAALSPADLWALADTTGDGRPDVVVLAADGVRRSTQGENGTFAPAGGELVLKAFGHGKQAGGWLPDKHPRFLADTTGSGRLDIVGCHDDGVWVSLQDEEGKFAPLAGEPALRAFGHGEKAGGWLPGRHPRFLADTTGSGRLDIVGFHDDGVWVSLQEEDHTFSEPLYVLDEFGADQGWSSAREHPRFLAATTGGGPLDLLGFGPQGVVVARGRSDGTFESPQLVLNDFGAAQGWTGEKHLRLLADVTGDGNPDLVGFGDEGVWVAHNRGDGRFEQAQLVCRGFAYDDAAGAWRVDRHPRFLADVTGDGRVDLVGFGGPGVHVARNLFRRFTTR